MGGRNSFARGQRKSEIMTAGGACVYNVRPPDRVPSPLKALGSSGLHHVPRPSVAARLHHLQRAALWPLPHLCVCCPFSARARFRLLFFIFSVVPSVFGVSSSLARRGRAVMTISALATPPTGMPRPVRPNFWPKLPPSNFFRPRLGSAGHHHHRYFHRENTHLPALAR